MGSDIKQKYTVSLGVLMKNMMIIKKILMVSLALAINLQYNYSFAADLNADKIARSLADSLLGPPYIALLLQDSSYLGDKVKLVINTRKQEAYIMAMGHEIFRMRARNVDLSPPGLSLADNWIELQGNRKEKIYLDIAKRILFFNGKDDKPSQVFAHVNIDPPFPHVKDVMVVHLLDHQPVEFVIVPKYHKAYVEFNDSHDQQHLLFVMHAKKIKIKGSSVPIYQLKYKNNYKDGIYFNPGRKILYFRSGRIGVFAKVKFQCNDYIVDGTRFEEDWDKVPPNTCERWP